jgi:import inner membrane translocase subunit TIM22
MESVLGVAIGAFFSMMNASFQYEDPMLRSKMADKHMTQRARDIFKEMGVNMWRSGRGFGKVGALFAGIECAIEGVRGKYSIQYTQLNGFVVSSEE